MSKIPDSIREGVRTRERGQCIRCGVPYTEVHHRQPRRISGHTPWTCIGLCSTCHKWAHANPTNAKDDGYIISIHHPAGWEVPIKAFYGTVTLREDWGVESA